jgi:hypothetical protein
MFSLYIAAINKNIPKNCMNIILPGKIIIALKNRKAMTKIVISFFFLLVRMSFISSLAIALNNITYPIPLKLYLSYGRKVVAKKIK